MVYLKVACSSLRSCTLLNQRFQPCAQRIGKYVAAHLGVVQVYFIKVRFIAGCNGLVVIGIVIGFKQQRIRFGVNKIGMEVFSIGCYLAEVAAIGVAEVN